MAAQGLRTAMGTVSGTMTTTTTGCTGEGCRTRETWPLHHVKHRGVFVRLCTSCVLKYHPSLFCSLCHELLIDCSSSDLSTMSNSPSPTPSTNSIIHCSSCPNVCHSSCLPPSSSSASSDFFLCPSCSSSSAAATADALLSSRRKTLDLPAARALLCAARIAAHSMSRAVAAARSEADRKAKEAAAARKRAREMIQRVADATKREREKEKNEVEGQELDRPGKERVKPKGGVIAASAGGSREREKWMRLYDMSTPFRDSEKPVPLPVPVPAAKFEQDDIKDTVAPLKSGPNSLKSGPNSVSKVNPNS